MLLLIKPDATVAVVAACCLLLNKLLVFFGLLSAFVCVAFIGKRESVCVSLSFSVMPG